MKKLTFTAFLFISHYFGAFSQTNITVNATSVLRTLSGVESGMNLNYLVDGNLISPVATTTNALKNMGVKMLRYPGGEKSDNYFFSASPWTSSSPRMALTDAACYWPTNDPTYVDQASPNKLCKPEVLDFDEFMAMCNTIGAQPLIVVAYDGIYNTLSCAKPTKAQLITHAAEWVRYANITKGYNAKYWMIGNESWNQPTYNGQTTPAQYAIDINDFAIAMKAVDPTIKIIANGKSGWWQTLLQSPAAPNIDFLAFSEYPTYNYTGGYDYYRTNNVNLTPETNAAISDINTYATTADKARIKVIPAEFNSIDWSGNWSSDNNMGHALANFQMFGDMVVKPKVETACMWNTRWVNNVSSPQHINDALDASGNFNANGLAQSVWSNILLNTMVTTTSSNDRIRVFASYNSVSRKLHIAILNKENTAQLVNTSISNFVANFAGSRWEMKGTSTSDKFPAYTKVSDITMPSDISSVTVPANSVTVFRLQDVTTLSTSFISFTGNRINAKNTVTWIADEHTNITLFEVEKSRNGSSFNSIAQVHESSSASYSYTDEQSIYDQTAYYRLKMIAKNGSVTYSGIVRLEATTKNDFTALVSPNPVAGELRLQFLSEKKRTITATIVESTGRVVFAANIMVNQGNNSLVLNGSGKIAPGFYTVELMDGIKSHSVRFVKVAQ